MSDVRRQRPAEGSPAAGPLPRQRDGETGAQQARPEPTLWAGWVIFGAMMMILLGAFQALAGVVALVDQSTYVVSSAGLLVQASYTIWGWLHIALGVVALVTGFGLMRGAMWARVLGVLVALVSAVVNLGFLAAAPFWATMMIALDVIVIFAITAHGRELRDAVV